MRGRKSFSGASRAGHDRRRRDPWPAGPWCADPLGGAVMTAFPSPGTFLPPVSGCFGLVRVAVARRVGMGWARAFSSSLGRASGSRISNPAGMPGNACQLHVGVQLPGGAACPPAGVFPIQIRRPLTGRGSVTRAVRDGTSLQGPADRKTLRTFSGATLGVGGCACPQPARAVRRLRQRGGIPAASAGPQGLAHQTGRWTLQQTTKRV